VGSEGRGGAKHTTRNIVLPLKKGKAALKHNTCQRLLSLSLSFLSLSLCQTSKLDRFGQETQKKEKIFPFSFQRGEKKNRIKFFLIEKAPDFFYYVELFSARIL